MPGRKSKIHARLLGGAASIALLLSAGAAYAQDDKRISIPSQSLASALHEFGVQSGRQVLFKPSATASKMSQGVNADSDIDAALTQLLAGTGMSFRRAGDVFLIEPEGGSSPQDESAGDVDALIVTAQKREEAIQDVPIAISAFSQKALEEQKIEGGFDLLKAIPNVTFSKSNFSSYNFSIRGVGTKAISATTDPGVAVAFNSTTLIQNRLFEQEYFDVERVEVLRGPQGTLYGRNATSGVINVISAKPKLGDFEGSLKAEIGNYDTRRLVGMANLPIIEDVLAVRLAGAMTQRSGFDYNEGTGNNVNGRDLWSGRVTVGFEPTPSIRANLLWEHFEEDDNRSRTGKQLCHRDSGPDVVGTTPVTLGGTGTGASWRAVMRPALFSQGCKPGNLYDEAAFSAPNGAAMPFVYATIILTADTGGINQPIAPIGKIGNPFAGVIAAQDPYLGLAQSKDLRTISSIRDPIYRAKADVIDLSIDFDLTDALTISSQTVYNEDEVYSFQDFNRFNSASAFMDTTNWTRPGVVGSLPSYWVDMAPGGVFCDPQIGCSDKIAGFDISQANGKQFSQEIRVQSALDGPLNFSLGANYTAFETDVDYYVMYNLITVLAMIQPAFGPVNEILDPAMCPYSGGYVPYTSLAGAGPVPAGSATAGCPYIDPNPVEQIGGDGHNYFRSRNPYELTSQAVFGELYWGVNDTLKVTAGLRYTADEKTFTPVPSQVLLAPGILLGGTVSRGYPELEPIVQEWGEWTGRLGLDWHPEVGFTDETMVYGFYSRGYKGGGANPPSPGFATAEELAAYLQATGASQQTIDNFTAEPVLRLTGNEYERTFKPEFVNALEVGAKNTLLGGAMTLNATTFYYDYSDYQVSQIRDRTAVNENFDATIWGLELETVFAPSRDFRVNANFGYLDTRIADGASSIDTMNRTQGNPDLVVVKPWVQLPSNCVVPTVVAESYLQNTNSSPYWTMCGGWEGALAVSPRPADPNFGGAPYDETRYDGTNGTIDINGGAGVRADIGGNELPNAPHWTMNVGAQYGRDVLDGSWRLTLRGDAYWQSQSWARVYNAVNDKLHGWYNVNIGVTLVNADLGLQAEFYAKNVLDKSPITDAFLNSDDTALTTNVFVLDPRLIGFSLRKTF